MLTLINGDGNPRVTAAQDADWYGSLTGEKTCIMPANDKFSATVADANTIEISSGVLITKEGRRVQIDAETIEEIIIPTGTQGTDTYYIIGFHLHIDESGQQVAETFVETMENESDTITETTFREGSTSIYISLYRVKRNGLTLESVTRICPMYELSADEIVYGNTNVGSELTQINQGLSAINTDLSNIYDSSLVSGSYNVSILFGSGISGLGAPSYNIPHFLKRKDITITGVSGTNLINTYASSDSGEATHFPIRGDKLLGIYLNGSGNVCVPVTFNYTVS